MLMKLVHNLRFNGITPLKNIAFYTATKQQIFPSQLFGDFRFVFLQKEKIVSNIYLYWVYNELTTYCLQQFVTGNSILRVFDER